MENKLMADIRAVPSWVWLGGAAAIGLLFVLGRAAPSSAAPPGGNGPVVSSSVPALGQNLGNLQDYGTYTELANIETMLQELYNRNPPPGGNGGGNGGGGNGAPTILPSNGKYTMTSYGAIGKNPISFLVDYNQNNLKPGSETYPTYVLQNGSWMPVPNGDIVGYVANQWGVSNPSAIAQTPGYYNNSVNNYNPNANSPTSSTP